MAHSAAPERVALRCAAQLQAVTAAGVAASDVRWVRTRHGFDMAVLSRGDLLSKVLLRSGAWESDHLAVIETLDDTTHRGCKRHDHAPPRQYLDVGANLGYFSLLAASRGFEVDAFEVLPRNVAMMNLSLCANE